MTRRTCELRALVRVAPVASFGYTEPYGSVYGEGIHSPCGPDTARGPRAARARNGDDHRARRAVRHLADRHEEARPRPRGGGSGRHREGRPRATLHARALRLRGDHDVAAAPRSLRAGRRTHERRTMKTQVSTPNEHEIRVERVFDAPRDHVFAVWTDPELIPEWWGDGTVVEEMDVRAGGRWKFRTEHGV